MRIAFFDFDRTLLAKNSAALWFRQEFHEGRISRWQAFRASLGLFGYHLGFSALEGQLRSAIAGLRGTPMQTLRERTRAFYESRLRMLYRPGGQAALAEHRRLGDKLVLLTSSSAYLAEQVAQELALDHVLCNRFEVDTRGQHTGRSEGELCFGEGKLRVAQAYVESLGASLVGTVFYTDSFSDLPVMNAVGRAVAVNPDRRLRAEAKRRGWEIADWGEPQNEVRTAS
ncbi:MAG: HAD family hydrolase [Myxococcaceae bacterium]